MENLRILFLSALDLSDDSKGGDGLPQKRTVDFYCSRGDEVTFITSNHQKKDIYNHRVSNKIKPKIIGFESSVLKKIKRVPKIGYVWTILFWLYFQIRAFFILRKLNPAKYDILYAYEIYAVPILKLVSLIYKKPLVTRFQGTIVPFERNIKIRIRLWHHIIALKIKSDLVIMTNDGTDGEGVIRSLRGDGVDIEFLINGIEDDFFRESYNYHRNLECDQFRLVAIGRLVKWKGFDRVLSAFSLVKNKVPNAHLYIAGDGPEKYSLMKLSESLEVASDVHFLGVLNHDDLKKLISNSDAYISMYDFSNAGKTLLEVMAVGQAIIATNVGKTKEFLVDGSSAILVEDSDIIAASEAVIKVASDAMLASKLRLGSKMRAQKILTSWNKRFEYERSLLLSLSSRLNQR